MKLRIVFLKKKYIYYTLIGIALLVLIIILLTLRKSTSTFNVINVNANKTKKVDLTGDGKDDILYIKSDNNKYMIEVDTSGKNFILQPDKKINTLGDFCGYWPMRITLLDVTRDKIPEIIVQDSIKGKPLQHIFMWNGDNFSDVYSSNNNTIGFIDSKNNKTPKIVSGFMDQNKINFSYYYSSNNKFQSFTYEDKVNFMGKSTVQAFINYIQSLPYGETYKPQGIFSSNLSGKDISIIEKLSEDKNTYAFQDCIFKDTKWDKGGNPLEIQWTLSFKGTSLAKNEDVKNYTLDILLKPYSSSNGEDSDYKIYSINLL